MQVIQAMQVMQLCKTCRKVSQKVPNDVGRTKWNLT